MNIKEKLNKYINDILHNNEMFKLKNVRYRLKKNCSFNSDSLCDLKEKSSSFPIEKLNFEDIQHYITNHKNENKFQQLLFHFIDKKKMKDSEVYNKVHIDRRLFSKIRSNESYHPSKETVILLGLALELSEKEIEELLESASYSLPKNNIYDLIIRFCFVEGIYKLVDVNELLDSYSCNCFE